jgi:hypothetical protein
MFVRLAFAVAVQVDPDILIVDEALSVGDMRFQQKCFRRMKAFKESGKTVIFVTHDQGTVTNFCDYVYWLKDGAVHAHGTPADVVKKYISYMAYGMDTREAEEDRDTAGYDQTGRSEARDVIAFDTGDPAFNTLPWEDISACSSFGEGGARITAAAFVHDRSLDRVDRLEGGEPVSFCMKLTVDQPMENLGIGINVNDHLGNTIFAVPSYVYDVSFPALDPGTGLNCRIHFDFPRIKNGRYSLSAAVAEGNQINHIQHHWVHDICFVEVASTDLKCTLGTVVVPDSRFEISLDAKG